MKRLAYCTGLLWLHPFFSFLTRCNVHLPKTETLGTETTATRTEDRLGGLLRIGRFMLKTLFLSLLRDACGHQTHKKK